MNQPIAFQGEIMLLGWKETHNGGAQVAFLLSDPSELEAFKAMTVAKGKIAGQRLACVLVEVDDEPIPPARTAEAARPSEEGRQESGEGEVESRKAGKAPPNELARKLHIDGYFRSPKLWLAMHDSGLYTAQAHFEYLMTIPCYFHRVGACAGDEVVHHCNAAAATDGGKRQPEAPQKPLHYWGVRLCHAHHQWAHTSTGATREDKENLVAAAVAITADQMKARMKTILGIESLSALTPAMLKAFEEEIGL